MVNLLAWILAHTRHENRIVLFTYNIAHWGKPNECCNKHRGAKVYQTHATHTWDLDRGNAWFWKDLTSRNIFQGVVDLFEAIL